MDKGRGGNYWDRTAVEEMTTVGNYAERIRSDIQKLFWFVNKKERKTEQFTCYIAGNIHRKWP